MFYVSSVKGNLVGIMDTYDNVEEFYTPSQIKEISKQVSIKGVSSKGIKKINLGEALLTREVVEKINCEKSLSFEVVDNLSKYKLLGRGKIINDDFIVLETDTDIKLLSDKVIMLDNSVFDNSAWKGLRKGLWKGLFQDTNFNKIDFHSTNTSNVKYMGVMFERCQAISMDLSSFDTFNVVDMHSMFSGCQATSLDLSSFDTSNVENMVDMFSDCHATSIDLSSFNTSNVEDMESMFDNCHVISLDLSSFDTSNVKDMRDMFKYCQATSLDLSNFDTSNVVRMDNMFYNCYAASLNLSSFNTSGVNQMGYIFSKYKGIIKTNDTRLLKVYNEMKGD